MQIHLKKHPLVSVVIPVYNGAAFIAPCLESVYKQSYDFLEVIVVDDGSTDGSVKIVENYTGEKKIIRQSHGDVSAARNAGAREAAGEYIAFIDHDDLWLPDKVKKQVDVFMGPDDVDLVFTDLIKLYTDGKRHQQKDKHRMALSMSDDNVFSILIRKNLLMPSTVMVRRERFWEAGGFDETFQTCGDYEMWLRMSAMGMRIRYLPEALTLYRQHTSNAAKQTEVMHRDRIKAIEKTFSNPGLTPEMKILENIGLASAYTMGAHTFFSIKDYRGFIDNAKKARAYSRNVVDWKFISRYVRSWLHLR